MKVLLREDVRDLGSAGDTVEVREGYARNYLLPKHLAVEPNPANVRRIEKERAQRAEHEKRQLESLKALAQRMSQTSVSIKAKANELGHLFGSVTEKHIADALTAEGFHVSEAQVALAAPIRTLDKFRVPIRLAEGIEAEVDVWVVPV
ncbi:MAG: 50S ribosomal protein L9 [Phycisphaerae bacterium]